MAKSKTEVPVKASTAPASKALTEEERRGPRSAVPRVQHEIERLFDDFMSRNWLRRWGDEWPSFPAMLGDLPRMDVIDRDKEVVVKAEVPGFTADDIELSISDNMLTVKGSSREEKEDEGEYRRREIRSNYLSRSVSLPAEVDGTKAKAQLRDGVLEVKVPKSRKSTRRTIKVE